MTQTGHRFGRIRCCGGAGSQIQLPPEFVLDFVSFNIGWRRIVSTSMAMLDQFHSKVQRWFNEAFGAISSACSLLWNIVPLVKDISYGR